ncbi:MAG TPA: hypothetical protein VFU68_06015 [Terracidiphilus sp.]|nr:hypothetical protein [Terracidiphilus sp.]
MGVQVSYYVLKDRYAIPAFLFNAVGSWVIVFAGLSIVLLANWGISATTHFELLKSLPSPLMTFLDICGVYAAFGAFCLYMAMWVYWIAVERSPVLARVAWLLALIFLLPYGALIYAIAVWKKDVTKFNGPQPVK